MPVYNKLVRDKILEIIEADGLKYNARVRNVATYKFAFAKTLFELGESNKSFVSLEEISPIFAKYMLEHIRNGKRQITSQSSKFISALDLFHHNQITWEQLLEVTEK